MANTTLEKMLIQGKPNALSLVKSLVNTPTLIYTGKFGGQKGLPYAIQLETETHKMSGSAQVSESLIIANDTKRYITDNVAPGAWSWTMSGYIPGNAFFEHTCNFTPFVTFHTELLKKWFKEGYVLTFKDSDCQLYQRVVIQSLDIDTQKDVKNKTPFTMVLKEINVMESSESELSKAEKLANAVMGGSLGASLALGAVMGVASLAAGSSSFEAVKSNLKLGVN